MRTFFYFVWFWSYLFKTMWYNFKYNSLGKKGLYDEQKAFVYQVTQRWGEKTILKTGSLVQVKGVENIPKENVLFVANHQSYFDIPLLIGFLPRLVGFVAKIELEKVPFISLWMKRLGCIFLDRDNLRASLKTIVTGIDKLKSGESLVIFPEGTRSWKNEMGEFKQGSLKLATKSDTTIVPITIDGTYRMFEEYKSVHKSNIIITIHEPIPTKGLSQEEQKLLTERVYEIIRVPLVRAEEMGERIEERKEEKTEAKTEAQIEEKTEA